MAAPAFAELEWTPVSSGGWIAEGTAIFWRYYDVDRDAFKALGFSVSKPAAKWVISGPDINADNGPAFRALIERGDEVLAAARDRNRVALQEQERRDAIRRAQRAIEARAAREAADALVLEARSLRHSKIVNDARAAGQACLDRWGIIVHRKDTLADLVRLELLTHAQIRLVHQLVLETDRKVAKFARDAAAIRDDECVNWSDDVVERAARHLTALDADHAKLANAKGWSGSETSKGHWCVAMFETDRKAALLLARSIVGPYREQLAAILTPQEMP